METIPFDDLLPVRLAAGRPDNDVLVISVFPAAETPGPGHPGPEPGDLFLRAPADGPLELVVSVGKPPQTQESYRRAGGAAGRWLIDKKVTGASIAPDSLVIEEQRYAFLEGLRLASYRYDGRKQIAPAENVVVWAGSDAGSLEKVSIQTAAVALTREWGHEPANIINPATLAERARTLAGENGLKCTILEHEDLVELGAGALVAVGQGSETGSRMIILEYAGAEGNGGTPVALVGKAITFDTGGYSLKSVENIRQMKYDKMGGIAVLATMAAAARLNLPVPVVGVVCAAENMVSAQAYRPDDIITSLSGKTIEIITTDAEGRLVLADGLTYVQRNFTPRAIIDLATLTGGVVTALGGIRAGIMSNNDELVEQLTQAGDAVYERLWRLPLDDEYLEATKGDDSDLKNSGGKEAHPIMGGIFLKQFIEDDTPWAHLDIAGTASSSKDLPYSPKGATGFGVRLLLRYLETL